MKIDRTTVPPGVESILPLAERWGIHDDGYREDALRRASRAELEEIVDAGKDPAFEIVFDWLNGTTVGSTGPSAAYVTLTCFAMAFYQAKNLLKRMGES